MTAATAPPAARILPFRPDKKAFMGTNRMWGGRFSDSPAQIMEEINASIDFDRRLAPLDIEASLAHAAMLARQGIISPADADAIREGLNRIHRRSPKAASPSAATSRTFT